MHWFKSISKKSKSARLRRRSGSLFWRKKLFLIGLGIFFIGTCATLVGLKQFGYFGKIIEIATQSFFIDKIIKPELRVNYIFVEGRSETSSKKLLQSLRLNRGQFILDFKPEEARLRIEKLPWVETAIIERHLPDTIRLTIKEKKPLALWQRNGELLLLDAKGKIINLPNINSYTSLIIIIGKDAPIRAESLFNVLAAEPILAREVKAAVRIGARRWNLFLKNNIQILLPENNTSAAWGHLAQLNNKYKLLSRDLVSIDLRLLDRVIIQDQSKIEIKKLNNIDDKYSTKIETRKRTKIVKNIIYSLKQNAHESSTSGSDKPL
jgi:cell division protein FtsQ